MSNDLEAGQQFAARFAAAAYLVSFPFLLVANFGLRGQLLVPGNVAETIRKVADAELVFRISIAFDLVYCVGIVAVLAALYVVLAPISRLVALLATLWKLIYVATGVLIALSLLAVVRLVDAGASGQTLGPGELSALVMLSSTVTWDEYYVGLLFWGLSGILLGFLWFRSRYIPRSLAILGIASSAWAALSTLTYIIAPAFGDAVNRWFFDTPMALYEVVLSIWLLGRGLRVFDPTKAGKPLALKSRLAE